MRNLRKLTAVVIAVALVLTSMTTVFAAFNPVYGEEAATMKDLGLYAGTDANDVTAGLDGALTTQDSLIFLAKLFGYFEAANELTDEEVADALAKFDDADKISAYAKKVVAYSAINEILNGSTKGGKFFVQAKDTVTDIRFATFMLKQMGYEVPDYTESVAQISELEGSAISSDEIGDLTRDDAVGMMYGLLTAEKADGETVIAGIVGDDATLQAIAVDAGLIEVADVAIASAAITGVKTVTVKFNQAVDTTKAVIKVKKGAAIYGSTVAWNDKKDTATLTTIVNLPAADYTVEVTGLTEAALTKAFTVAAQAASKVEVTSTTIALSDSAPITFKVLNQYGEDMKIAGTAVVVSAYNTTQKADVTLTSSATESKFTVPANFKTAGTTKLNDVIRVTIAYAGLTAQGNVTVIDPASNSSIAFGEVVPKTGTTRITVGDTGLSVPYTLYDQYSIATKLPAYTPAITDDNVEVIGGVQFVSSNKDVVDVDNFTVDADGKLTFKAGTTAGTATITAVINASGSIAQFVVTVNGTVKVDSLVIAAPSALVAAGETVKLDLTAADQYGAAIAAKDISGVTVTSSNTAVVSGTAISAGKLNVPTLAAGTTTLTAKVGDKVVGSVTIVVEAAAEIMQVKSVSFPAKFELGAAKTMGTGDFAVIDQYGRTISSGVTFTVGEKTAADTQFIVTGAAITADKAGSSVMTLTATYNAKSVTYDFTLTAVASSDIVTYAITAVPTMYSGKATFEALHAKTLELVGKTAAGETVVLKADKIVSATSSDISKATVSVTGGVAKVTGVTGSEGTVVVSVWDVSAKLAETTITLSKVAPVVTTVSFNDSVETALVASVVLSDNIVVKDQYGVAIPDVGFWTTSDATKATVSGGTVTMGTASTGDTVTIGYVSSNGLVVTTVLTK